jgi:hypothetical protein
MLQRDTEDFRRLPTARGDYLQHGLQHGRSGAAASAVSACWPALTKDTFRPYIVSMEDKLTVSLLADRIGAHEIGGKVFPHIRDRVVRQLRYWTASGVMRPASGTLTGTGRHRQYGQESILVAAVLVELARTLGLGLATLKSTADALYEDVFVGERAAPSYWKAQVAKSLLYLRLTFDEYKEGEPPVCAVTAVLKPEDFGMRETARIGSSSVVVDLARFLERVGT